MVAGECADVLRAARRFRAGLSDALDAAVQELLQSIAREVLARELELGRAEVAAIVAAALDRFGPQKVLVIRAHPSDLEALAHVDLDCVADDALRPGDLRLELRSGTIDLTLEARLEAVLAARAA